MSKKAKAIIAGCLAAIVLMVAFSYRAEKCTIIDFADDAVIIASENGKRVIGIENYHTYIPAGEQWEIGDKVKFRDGVFSELSIQRIVE